MQIQILEAIKARAKTERRLSEEVELDLLVLSPIITDLIMEGYVEIIRRKRFFIFSREYCVITIDGINALQSSKNPIDWLFGLLRGRASEILNDALGESLLLRIVVAYFRALFKLTRLLVR